MNFTRTAVWDGPGLMVTYNDEILLIEDLNPEQKIKYRVTRWEAVRIGFWLIRRALFRR